MSKFKIGERVRIFFLGLKMTTAEEALKGFPGTIERYNYAFGYDVKLDDGSTEKSIGSHWIESMDNPTTTFRTIIRELSEDPAMKRRFKIDLFCSEKAGFYEYKYPNSICRPEIIIKENGIVEFDEFMRGDELAAIAKASIAAQKLYEAEHGKEDA